MQLRQEPLLHQRGGIGDIVARSGPKQWNDVVVERGHLQLGGQIRLEFRAGYPGFIFLQIAFEALDHLLVVECERRKREPQIEQVAPLPALVERTQFRSEQLLDLIGVDIRASREPRAVDGESAAVSPEDGEMLARIDLDFEPHRLDRPRCRLEPVEQRDPPLALFASRLVEPWIQRGTDRIDGWSDRTGVDLNQVDVLGISAWRLEKQLVKRSPAAER